MSGPPRGGPAGLPAPPTVDDADVQLLDGPSEAITGTRDRLPEGADGPEDWSDDEVRTQLQSGLDEPEAIHPGTDRRGRPATPEPAVAEATEIAALGRVLGGHLDHATEIESRDPLAAQAFRAQLEALAASYRDVPSRIGGLHIEGLLGRDPQTASYAARSDDGRPCVLRRFLGGPGPDRDRFEAEAEAALELEHPGLAPALAFGFDGGAPHLVRARVDGLNLRALGALAGAPLPMALLLDLLEQTGRTLAWVHATPSAHGPRMHGELAPSAILVTPSGRMQLTEPGLCRIGRHRLIAGRGGRSGRPGYAAPEQLYGRPLDPRVDVFSLAIAFTEALTGIAFGGGGAVLLDALDAEVKARLAARPDAPPGLGHLLRAMVQRSPERRPEMERVARAARGLLDEEDDAPELASWLAPIFARAPAGPSRALALRPPAELERAPPEIEPALGSPGPRDASPTPAWPEAERPDPRREADRDGFEGRGVSSTYALAHAIFDEPKAAVPRRVGPGPAAGARATPPTTPDEVDDGVRELAPSPSELEPPTDAQVRDAAPRWPWLVVAAAALLGLALWAVR